jgi:hypothetical protein
MSANLDQTPEHNPLGDEQEPILTKAEVEILTAALQASYKVQAPTQKQIHQVITWACITRSNSTLLSLALKGLVKLAFRNGELTFELSSDGEILFDKPGTGSALIN